MTETIQTAIDKLAAMASVDEMARWLAENGYKAIAGSSGFDCPVAKYLRDKCQLTYNIGVTPTEVWTDGVVWEEYPLPQKVTQLIEEFDGGQRPELHS